MVKNEKDAQEVNRMFLEKIRTLEKEKAAAKAELVGLQKDFEMKHQQDKAMNEQLQRSVWMQSHLYELMERLL